MSGLEAACEDDPPAQEQERHDHAAQSGDVRCRDRQHGRDPRRQAQTIDPVHAGMHHGQMGDDRALGPAGGARRVHDAERIILGHADRLDRRTLGKQCLETLGARRIAGDGETGDGGKFGEMLLQLRLVDHGAGVAVPADELDLRTPQANAHRHRDGAELGAGEQRDHELRSIVENDRDAVAPRHAPTPQSPRQPGRDAAPAGRS